MRKAFLIIAACFICLSSFAGSDIDVEKIKALYSKYNAVVTEQENYYLIDIVGDSISVKQTYTKQVLILNDYSKAFTNDYIYSSSFSTIEEKKAHTMVPNGKSYKKIEVSNFKESHDRDRGVFYDDTREIKFSYPSVQHGAITYLNYTIIYKNPRFIRKSYLQSFIPIVKLKVRAKVNRDIDIAYKVFNEDAVEINFTEYSKGKYNYYEWEVSNVEPYKYSGSRSYTLSYYSPHVVLYIKDAVVDGVKERFFGTPADLYKFYEGFITQVDKSPSEDIKMLVDKLTDGLDDDTEKAKAIYYWVQKNIKYVAYEDGYAGFVPSPASEVFTKRFGDCKGKTSLIVEMMKHAGLPTYYTWVGTRSIPYTYEELPLPAVDNHMLATYLNGDSVIIMDGTSEFIDYGDIPYQVQGKELLIGLDSSNYMIYDIPVSPATDNTVYDSFNIIISGDSIMGEGKRRYTGLNKVDLAYAMDGVKEKDYNKRFSRLFPKGNNKYKVVDHKVYNLFEHHIAAEVDYDFVVKDYMKILDDDIYINLNLDKSYQDLIIDTSDTFTPLENDFYFTDRNITRFKIPEGYELTYIPEDDSFISDNYRYEIKYTKEGDYITQDKLIVFEFFHILDDQFDEWNKMIKSLDKHYRSALVLKKIK